MPTGTLPSGEAQAIRQSPAFRRVIGACRDLRAYAARFGYRRTLIRIATDSLRRARILRVSCFLVLRSEDVDPAAFSSQLPYTRTLETARAMRRFQCQLPEQLPDSLLDVAEASGDECYAICDGDQLVSFGWYAARASSLFGRRLTFSPEAVYMYHGFTLPAYRGQHLHALGLAEALSIFAGRGKSAIISTVNSTNFRARQSTDRLGFREQGSIVQLGPVSLGLLLVSRGARAYDVRLEK